MGDFAFARSFDMLRDEKWHHVVIMLRRAMSLLGPLSPVPWLAQIGFSLIPGYWVVKDWYSMMDWCKNRMTDRIAVLLPIPCSSASGLTMQPADGARETGCLLLSHRRLRQKQLPRARPSLAERRLNRNHHRRKVRYPLRQKASTH